MSCLYPRCHSEAESHCSHNTQVLSSPIFVVSQLTPCRASQVQNLGVCPATNASLCSIGDTVRRQNRSHPQGPLGRYGWLYFSLSVKVPRGGPPPPFVFAYAGAPDTCGLTCR